ncbi:unnamed protein product [Cladocopium goreaui]|uniref:DnaJ-like subfamily A member 2 n=1 Tax=Cladocopium goreaui TaxID=2562237 RepID=A0A9P1GF36_9DINO|nr:unnamed protein product [Cladocopium goreaui]
MPSEVEKPNQKWCRNFVKNFGWSLLSPSMEQASLPFDHPDMKLYRDNYKKMITTGQVHPYLVLNFDQVWRCAFSWSGRMHWKPRENVGKRSKKVKTPKTLDKKRHAVRGARKSVTALTSSWADGSRGPICFCLPEGAIPAASMREWNAKHVGASYIISTETSSHFMHSNSLLEIYDQCYSVAFHLQRKKLGLSDSDRGAVICDAWTGSFSRSRGEETRRNIFYESHNVEPPLRPVGGWSAHGQPVDQLHGVFRSRIRHLDLLQLDMGRDLRKRPEYHEMPIRSSGLGTVQIRQLEVEAAKWLGVVQLSFDAWVSLEPKIFQSAWISCGYMSAEDFPPNPAAPPPSIQDAREALDVFGRLGGGTPQRCTRFEWQIKDTDNAWKALPYEAAGAMVRSLMLHCHRFSEAKVARDKALEEDPEAKKAVTQKLVEKVAGLSHVDKYLVFNPRTGQLATEMWLSAHIQVVNGKPQFKHPSKQYKDPKILTLTIKIDNGSLDCLLDLGNGDSKPVRCYDLRSSATPTDMDILLGGFGHMADKWQDDDDEGDRWEDFDEVDFDENEFEDQIVDDSNGLEGHALAEKDQQIVLLNDDDDDEGCGSEGGDEWEFPDEMIDKDKFNENLADTMVVAKGKLASSESGSADGTGVKNRAPKWSESVRSERKALLLALRFLWETYVSDGNSDGQHHVDQLNAALALFASQADDDEDAEGASHRVAIVRGQHASRSKRAINARNAWKRCATLVMTPALLVDSLIHARVVITDIVLLVLDEAHQLKGTSEYAILMKRFYSGATQVLALTASPLSGRAPGKSWQPASEEDMKRELEELEEKVDCRTWTELGLVEAEVLKTTVEERSFEMANSTDRHKELLAMIRSAKLEVSGNNRQRDQILRWNRTLERFEDGERCSIALELGEWATLRGLQLLCRGQAPAELEEEDAKDEEKSNGEDEKVKNVEPEELICQARERLQGKLTQWQEKQTEKLHSSKALACIQKLRERFQADGDMKCIVFTRTRALCHLLAMVLESEEELPGVTYVVGGNDCRVSSWKIRQTATSQKQALAKFALPHNEEGAVSIVVATSVLAEGIDIPSCGLVLCFDSAVSPLQHVQLRGRARRAGSEFTVLVPKGAKAFGALAAGPSLQQLKDYEVRVLNVLKAWSLRPPCPRQLGPLVSEEEEVLEISSSGARLPLEKAKNYLHVQVYGYLIPSEKSNEREILDFCKPGFRDNEKKYDYSMFQVKSSEQGWYSELELPPVGCCSLSLEEQTTAAAARDHSWWRKKEKPLCQEHLGMVVGPVVAQKGQAKDAAALRACRILHQMGILDDHLKVKGREKFQHLIKQATASGKASGKRRSDDAIALASIETLERKLPRCFMAPENPDVMCFQLHRLVLGEHPGKHGLALLLPEQVPSGSSTFLLLPPGLEEPLQVEVQWLAEVEFSQQQLDNLKVWTQLSLELSCRRTCPLHQAFGQVPLTHFKDRSGKWVPVTNALVSEDEDLPDRSYWLLAPVAPGSQAIHWDFVDWGLTSLNHLLQCESWQQMSSCFVGETKTLHLDMSLSDAVVLGLMPRTSRGSDVRCLCVDLEVQDEAGLMKGYKFSRASVNAGVAPDFVQADRNLHQERLEIEFKADECELIPLTLGQLQVLRSLPSLLWRLEFVALIQELPQDGLLQRTSLNVLGEALTHSQVRSLPFELPNYRFCLERLELLGDAALKLMASIHCGSCLPTAKEGELSKAAQDFETNKWLRHASKASWDLAQYILLEAFRPKDLLAGLRRGTAPQKVVADAMEAVLGAVFRSAAASASLASLGKGITETWRIFGVLLQKSPTDQRSKIHLQESFIPDFKNAALAALSSLRPTALTADELQSAKDAVLQATGYEFRRVELLGALRANASGTRSTSFERLEFLGDAAMQVMVSWHVMQLFPEFDEGELSDTQQALLCNYYISRKLVRNFDEAGLLHVFFPGAQSPLRSPLLKYLKAVRGQEAGDFLVGEKSDLAAGLQRLAVGDGHPFLATDISYLMHVRCLRLPLVCDEPVAETRETAQCEGASTAAHQGDAPVATMGPARRRSSAVREKRRLGERRSMVAVARRLKAVMEERGLSMVPEENDEEEEDDLTHNLFDRARSFSLSAVSSIAAAAAWAVTPQDTASTASSCTQDVSPRSSDDSVHSPSSLGSFSSDSTVHVLGEALLRAREEGEHPTRAGNVFSRGLGVALWARQSRQPLVFSGAYYRENSVAVIAAQHAIALIAAILLDTGGDLDQTWSVFAKDFDLSKVNVQEQIRSWRQHLREAEKKELIESGVLLPQSRAGEKGPSGTGRDLVGSLASAASTTATEPAAAPEFGLLAKGEARRKLMEYCKRHQLKMKFEGSQARKA